ncbi:MAG: hypothetical protein WA708_06985 [Acidobacteriaceae bacterium]
MSPAIRRTILVLRIFLAIVFINYGLVKVLGGQYYYGDWTISKSTVDGNGLIWAFFGYSPIYGRLTGLFELLPGIFILFRRTAWASAAALFAVSLNVTLMDYLFHFHGAAKQGALVYTILALAVVLLDYKKLRLVLASPEEVQAASTALRAKSSIIETNSKRHRPALITACIVIVAAFIVLDANFQLVALQSQNMPEKRARAALTERGLHSDELTFVRGGMRPGFLGFNNRGWVDFKVQTPTGARNIRVNEISPSGFVGWRVVAVTEMQRAASAPR